MRAIGPFLQLLFFSVFVAIYAVTFIPAALILALCTPRQLAQKPVATHEDLIDDLMEGEAD